MNNSTNQSGNKILPEEARVNYDGTPAETLEFGVIKRKVLGMSGKVRMQYVSPEFTIIPDYRKYVRERKESRKREAARQIQETYNEQENPNLAEHARSTGFKDTRDHLENPDATVAERMDKQIEKSLETGDMIDLSECFPDVGIYEEDGRTLPTNPAVRARQAAMHGKKYQKEYILRTLHRLLLRRVPTDQIAQMFNVSVHTIYNWIDELRARMKAEATTMSITQVAGDTLSFYNEIRSTGLTTASTAQDIKHKIKGMEVALKAEQDKHKFLQVAGFYDTAKLGRETMEDESAKKARQIINMTKNLLSGEFEAEEEDVLEEISGHERVII